jgi:hypothetical protein
VIVGATHVSAAVVLPDVPDTDVAAAGTPIGVTDDEADDDEDVPELLGAVTVNV